MFSDVVAVDCWRAMMFCSHVCGINEKKRAWILKAEGGWRCAMLFGVCVCLKNHTYGCANGVRFCFPLERKKKTIWDCVCVRQSATVSLSPSFTPAPGIMRGLMWNLNLDLADRKWQVTLFGMWLSQTPVQEMVLIDNCQRNRRWHVCTMMSRSEPNVDIYWK